MLRKQGIVAGSVEVKVVWLIPNSLIKEAEIALGMGTTVTWMTVTSVLYVTARPCIPKLLRLS